MNLFYKKTSDNKGFTLIEIIAVLIILGIMAAVAVSRMGSNDSDLIPQADIIKSHLRFAQLKALSDDTSASWGIAFPGILGSNSYTLKNGTSNAAINLPGEDGISHTFPTGSGITVLSSPLTVNFDSWGSPVGGGAATVSLYQGGVLKTTINIDANTGYIQ
jgi:prepilin-type N-terminal cleavage/methylation domain-containing protein